MTILREEIKAHDLIKVLVEDTSIDPVAKVILNKLSDRWIYVTYLVPTINVYKSARVYEFESVVNRIEMESISEHKPDDVSHLRGNMWVYDADIDTESESEIDEDPDSDDDSAGSLEDFIDDSEINYNEREQDCDPLLTQQWRDWSPRVGSAAIFKNRVDIIEYTVKQHEDNLKFMSK